MRLREIWARIVAALALAASFLVAPVGAFAQAAPVAGVANRATAPSPRPAIWLLRRGDTKIYLFGTIHILPPDLDWRSPALERVIDEADELVLEVSDEDMATAGAEAFAATMLGKTAPLAWRVSPERRAALAEMVAASGLPAEGFDRMQTWAVTMALSVAQIAQAYGVEDQADMASLPGVEERLSATFRERGRPVSGVETAAQQLRFLSSAPFAVQRRMLEDMIDAYAAGDASATDPGEEDWLQGRLEPMAAEMEEMPPELYEVLITRRNAAWTNWLIARLERPGTVLFAVGAGHLAGRSSVQSMLAARGYSVTRVD